MKILFIGSLIEDHSIDDIVKKSKVKPSNAPVYFEKMLAKGLIENGVELDVLSVPTVSTYPHGCLLAWGRRKETLDFGQQVTWIPCLNLMFFKQLSVRIGSFLGTLKWVWENRKEKEKTILNYSVYPPYSSTTQLIGRLFHVPTCSIITDLPEYLYKMGKASGLRKYLNEYYSKQMVKYQGRYDRYVFLTEHMAQRMKLEDKPSILMEGFADEHLFDGIEPVPKNAKKAVMYAGRLTEDFNIRALVDGFMQTRGDYELWLFGSGDMENYIQQCVCRDRRVRFFGKVDRRDLLVHMKMAHLLVSVKSPNEDHANYAFPSKILEYMTSGTAVASTMVGGIPKEYFKYIIPIERADAQGIKHTIDKILPLTDKEMRCIGEKTRTFAIMNKNYIHQSQRICDFFYHEAKE